MPVFDFTSFLTLIFLSFFYDLFYFFTEPADQLSEDIETLTIKEREDFDLTDKIWNVLKKVDSFAQLCDSWKYLFQMIKRDDIKPYVRSKSDTYLPI